MTLHRIEYRETDAKGRTLKRSTRYVERRASGAVATGNAIVPAGSVSDQELAAMRERITDLERRVAELEARPTPLMPVLSDSGAPMPAPDLSPALARIAALERELASVKTASASQIPDAAAAELERLVRSAGAGLDQRLATVEAALAALGVAAEEAARRKA